MHRHGYKGKKFGRETGQREALIKSLAESLILRESIETTLPKAKEVRTYLEKLITKAKKGGLHNRRQVVSGLQTLEAAHKLVDSIAPKLAGRSSGHLRVKRTELRRGDGAQMAIVSFVDDLKVEVKAAKKPTQPKAAPKTAKKPAAKAAPKPRARKTVGAK
jgi:large subunit ribosomal protein L17